MVRKLAWILLIATTLTGYTRCGTPMPPEELAIATLPALQSCQRGGWSPISRGRWQNDSSGEIISNLEYQHIPDAEIELAPGQCFLLPDCYGADPVLLGYFRSSGFNFVDPRPAVFAATGDKRNEVIGARFIYLMEPINVQQDHITEHLEDQEPIDALLLCARDDALPTEEGLPWRGWVTIGQTDADKTANGTGANGGYALVRYVIDILPGGTVGVDPLACGNGLLNPTTGEECDDGNNIDGDGCSADCRKEQNPLFSTCGNGTLDLNRGEECDYSVDHPDVPKSAWPTACDYGQRTCEVCTIGCLKVAAEGPFCGDGFKDSIEQCDDGNNVDGDGCSASCRDEDNPAVCGNGVAEPGEACDDGNTTTEDCAYGDTSCTVCTASCTWGAGQAHYCGDGIVDAAGGETCDDGNTVDGDGCESTCQPTPGSSITIAAGNLLTPDVNLLGGVRPRLTPEIAIAAVAQTSEPLSEISATLTTGCDPLVVSPCSVSASPTGTVDAWSVDLPALPDGGGGAAASYQAEIAVKDSVGVPGPENKLVDFEVYPEDGALEITCSRQYEAGTGDLVVSLAVAGTTNPLPPPYDSYQLSNIFDARWWLFQRTEQRGWVLDETDPIRTDFTLQNPITLHAKDDGDYQLVFTGLFGFTEAVQASLRFDTVGGPYDVCPLMP